MEFHSGKGGKATINGTEIPVIDWSVEPVADEATFRNSKTGDFTYRETTFKDATVTITLDYDFDENPFQAPVSLEIGATLADVFLYLNGTGGVAWKFPEFVVRSTPTRLAVAGGIGVNFTGGPNGPFFRPGEAVV